MSEIGREKKERGRLTTNGLKNRPIETEKHRK